MFVVGIEHIINIQNNLNKENMLKVGQRYHFGHKYEKSSQFIGEIYKVHDSERFSIKVIQNWGSTCHYVGHLYPDEILSSVWTLLEGQDRPT
jgi:hypothetical protein